MNEDTFESLKPPVTGGLEENMTPPMDSAEIDEAIDASADLSDTGGSLKPPVTG